MVILAVGAGFLLTQGVPPAKADMLSMGNNNSPATGELRIMFVTASFNLADTCRSVSKIHRNGVLVFSLAPPKALAGVWRSLASA